MSVNIFNTELSSRITLFIFLIFCFISAQEITLTTPRKNVQINTDEEIEIAWNSSGIDGDVVIQWAKTSSRNNWHFLDEVGVGEGSYPGFFPTELENYRGKIIIRIFSSSKKWVKDEVTIGPVNNFGKKTTSTSKKTTATTKLVAYVDKYYPNVGSYLNITWNQNTPVNIYYTKVYSKTYTNTSRIVITRESYSTKSYDWKIPPYLADTRIRIIVEDAKYGNTSDPIIVIPSGNNPRSTSSSKQTDDSFANKLAFACGYYSPIILLALLLL